MALWLSECARIVKPGGYALTFCDWRQLPLATDALQAGGFVWRGIVSWDKGESARAPHTGYFRHQCEFVVWGTNGVSAPATWGGPWPGCMSHPVLQSDKHHLTGKPTPLLERLVQCAPPGGVVLDPFMGSGTTGVAALRMGRRFIGMELDPGYYGVAERRIREAAAQLALWPPSPSQRPQLAEQGRLALAELEAVEDGRRCWRRELPTARRWQTIAAMCEAARRARGGHGVLECAMREWRRFMPLASQLDDALLSMDNLLGPTPKSAQGRAMRRRLDDATLAWERLRCDFLGLPEPPDLLTLCEDEL